MKKIAMVLSGLAIIGSLGACSSAFRNSDEQVELRKFLAECKADPGLKACVDWRESTAG